jgi:2-amino-4-hydroxy-6-hydroxymethyldihydropteridine diphosphokinase
MPRVLVALGANLGDRRATLALAVRQIAALPGVASVTRSAWYASEAIGARPRQPEFLNGAATFDTSLAPLELLGELHRIEARLGRVRDVHWGPRHIDLDLLYYGDSIVDSPRLTLPHLRMSFRRFVLAPAAEIAGDWPDPRDGKTIASRLARLRNDRDYIAFTGEFGKGPSLAVGMKIVFREARVIVTAEVEPANVVENDRAELRDQLAARLQREASATRAIADFPLGDVSASGFWLGQLKAEARARLTAPDYGQFKRHWREVASRAPSPKLLVVGDPPWSPERNWTSSARCYWRLMVELADVAAVLRLPNPHDRGAALKETLAAIEAMRAEPTLVR